MSLFLRRQVFTQLGGSRHGATAVRAAAALASSRQPVRRYSFSPESGLVDDWPISSANWILNVCPQGKRMIVERLGKMHHVHESGWFLAVPFVDRIAYIIDMRERAMEIPPQSCITRDNVSVQVSGNLYTLFTNPERAAYGNSNPLYAVRQHAQSSMRASIGELELDEILHARARLNAMVKSSVQEAAQAWGMEVKRYEITEVTPDEQISTAMDRQAAAERMRRERVLTAEGEKRAATLKSEGVKIQLINESEGALIRVQNEAQAAKDRITLEAQGEAEAILAKAKAQAEAIRLIAQSLQETDGRTAAEMAIAKQYIEMYGEMGQRSNTMLFSDRPADVRALFAQAAAVLDISKDVAKGGVAKSP